MLCNHNLLGKKNYDIWDTSFHKSHKLGLQSTLNNSIKQIYKKLIE